MDRDVYRRRRRRTLDVHDRRALAEALSHGGVPAARGSDGRLYLHLPDFARWVNVAHRLRLTYPQFTARLGRLGFTRKRLTARHDNGTQERRVYWRSPGGFDAEAT